MSDLERIPVPQDRLPALKIMAQPLDVDHYGGIPGGWLLTQMDRAGLIEAQGFAHGKIALVAVSPLQLKRPIKPGDVVSLYVERLRVGKTSISVKVEALVERAPENILCERITETTFTYVALDADGHARQISAQGEAD